MTDTMPWVKWRFDRWRNDEGLRMCGLAARGLWADLLCIMHGCDPYGHLSINGREPSARQIASMVGMTSPKEVTALLAELEETGVFSRSKEGLIYCRRMVRDNLARIQGKAYGVTGGNPSLVGKTPKQDNHQVNPEVEKGLTPPFKTDKREEKREEKEEPPLPPQRGGGQRVNGFHPRRRTRPETELEAFSREFGLDEPETTEEAPDGGT